MSTDEEFDATYGLTRSDLLRVGVPEEPAGFADFWRGKYADAMSVDTDLELRRVIGPQGTELYEVRFTSLDEVRVGGWLAVPADGDIRRGLVVGHGYGGRDEPDLAEVPEHTAAIFPVARGLPALSLLPDVPSEATGHVLSGIESVETYIHGGCAAEVWCAASALLSLYPDLRLGYVGGSFGGGIGAMALPWDARFTKAVLRMPSFGNHDVRLRLFCTGSGEAVRRHITEYPEARDVLRFFDAATAARRLIIPTLVAPAMRDPAVPPPGQFAVYNAIPGEKKLYVFSAGHSEYDAEMEELAGYFTALRSFLVR